jgi:hypothetical protein
MGADWGDSKAAIVRWAAYRARAMLVLEFEKAFKAKET